MLMKCALFWAGMINYRWNDYSMVAGAVEAGTCAWNLEIWNEIDTQGGHILAPANWYNAQAYSGTSSTSGFTGGTSSY
jgi:hypothetical protein